MKHLYFCRHGLSQLNKESRWAGSLETPLTDEGRAGAAQAGRDAKNLGIDYIVASTLTRAVDTARIMAREIGFDEKNIELNPLAIERHFGILEGTPWTSDRRLSMDGVEGVEPVSQLVGRARALYTHLQSLDAETVLVVSHGSFGRALRHVISPDIPFSGSRKFQNTEIIQLL